MAKFASTPALPQDTLPRMASQNISALSRAQRAPQAANFAALLEAVALDPAAIDSSAIPSETKNSATRKRKTSGSRQSESAHPSQGVPNRSAGLAPPLPHARQQAKAEPETSSRKPPKSLRISRKDAAPVAVRPAVQKAAQEPVLKVVKPKPQARFAQMPLPPALHPDLLHPDLLHEDLLASDTVAIQSAAPAASAGLPASAAGPILPQPILPQPFKPQLFKPQNFDPQDFGPREFRSQEVRPLEGQRDDQGLQERSVATDSARHNAVPDQQADDAWVRWPGPRRKCVTISVRLSPEDAKMLRRRANESQLSVSDYMRSCVLEADQLRAQVKQALAEMKTQGMDWQATAAREESAPMFAHQPHQPSQPLQPKESRLKGWFAGLRGPLAPASAMSSQR